MSSLPKAFRPARLLALGLLLGLLALVLYRAFSPPPWRVTEKDVRTAQREIKSSAAGDERSPVVDGSLVGGEGILEPADRESKVSSEVDGRIESVNVKERDHVKAGDVLITLRNDVEKAALAAAERDVTSQRAQLNRTAAGERREEIEAAIGDAASAEARAALSRDSLARTEKLSQGGAATPDDLDKARHQADIDEKAAMAAEARKRQAVDGARRDDVAIDAAKLEANLARAAQARAQYEQKIVRAPIDGEILAIKVRAGEFFNTKGSDPLLLMGDTRILRVRMDVNERDISRVRLGEACFAELPAYGARRFPGTVVELGRRMGRKNVRSDDPTERIDTKILEVVCRLDAPDELVPGLRVSSFIDPDRAHDRALPPTTPSLPAASTRAP